MKKILSAVLVAVMIIMLIPCISTTVSAWDGSTDESWYNDTDTTFTLENAAQLAGFAKLVRNGNTFYGKTVTLAADIDLNSIQWTGIGQSGKPFSGTFDGQSHKIANLCYSSAVSVTGYGLFRYVSDGCTIKNLTLDGVDIQCGKTLSSVGSLVGTTVVNSDAMTVNIKSCNALNVNISCNTGSRLSGLIGYLALGKSRTVEGSSGTALIDDCHTENVLIEAKGTVDSNGIAAGTGSLWRAAGMIAQAHCESFVKITESSVNHFTAIAHGYGLGQSGGLIACGIYDIDNCAVNDVCFKAFQGGASLGGVMAVLEVPSKIKNTVATNIEIDTGNATDKYSGVCGGFIGSSQNAYEGVCGSVIENCSVSGVDIHLAGHTGGVASPLHTNGGNSGGFIGMAGGDGLMFKNCHSEGTVDTTDYYNGIGESPAGFEPYNTTGGFAGAIGWGNAQGTAVTFDGCSADVDITAREAAGGFVGIATMEDPSTDNELSCTYFLNCSAYGNVSSIDGAAGGFCGKADRGTFTDCIASGAVASGNRAGGFIGEILSNGIGLSLVMVDCESKSAISVNGNAVDGCNIAYNYGDNGYFVRSIDVPDGTVLLSGSSSIPSTAIVSGAIVIPSSAQPDGSDMYLNSEIDGENGNPVGFVTYISADNMTSAPDTTALEASLDDSVMLLGTIGLEFKLVDKNYVIDVENAVLSEKIKVYIPYESAVIGRTYQLYHWNGTEYGTAADAAVEYVNGQYYLTFECDSFSPFAIVGSKSVTKVTPGTVVTYVGTGSEAYTVTVPATLAPGGSDNVTISGTWASNRKLVITADDTVDLVNEADSSEKVTLAVTFDDVALVGDNNTSVSAQKTVSVANVESVLFGTWSGSFNYQINIEDVE